MILLTTGSTTGEYLQDRTSCDKISVSFFAKRER